MSIENNIIELGKRAKSASLNMKVCSSDQKNLALTKLTKNLDKNRNKILEANKIDLENGEKKSLAKPLINRLTLTEKSIDGLITSIEDIIEIPDPIGITLEEWERPNGLQFRKISTPLGVLGVIYESRPNVSADAAGLTLKSGNTLILRGGSESFNSSSKIVALINVVIFSSVEAETEQEKIILYGNIYLFALIIPIISILGVLLSIYLKKK